MQFSWPANARRDQGFTLVELMVIAPIAILTIAGFIVLMITIVGNTMLSYDESKMMYDTNTALDTIEQDARLGVQFMTATQGVQTPQGTGSNFAGAGQFSNTDGTLIIKSLATSENPRDSTRNLVYYANQPDPCSAISSTNRVFAVTIVYFVKDNSLWRRTIVPPNNQSSTANINTTCDAPWQINSCSPGQTATICSSEDIRLVDNVSEVTVQYFSDPSSSTPISRTEATSASTIKITIESSKTSSGRLASNTQSLTVNKLNDVPANIGQTALAITKHPSNQSAPMGSSNVSFTSAANFSNASKQWQLSTNGGTSWSNISGETGSTLTLDSVTSSMNNYRYRMSASIYGSTVYSNSATLTVFSTWTPLSLQNNWQQYSTAYASPAYTQSDSGEVFLKGLIRYGTTTRGTVIGTLPSHLWPEDRLIFPVTKSSSTGGRIDINTNGDILAIDVHASYVSLDSIHFMPQSANCPVQNMTLQNGWTNYGSAYSPLRSCKDSDNRVHVFGLIKPGTTTTNTRIANWPSGFSPDRSDILSANQAESSPIANTGSYVAGITSRYTAIDYLNVMGSHYPSSYTGWSALPLSGSWVNYSASTGGYTQARFTKSADNIVTVEGLVKDGANTWDTVIGTLPPGYRPSERLMLGTTTNGGYGRLDITTSGQIRFMTGSTGWLSLSDISFVAEQ